MSLDGDGLPSPRHTAPTRSALPERGPCSAYGSSPSSMRSTSASAISADCCAPRSATPTGSARRSPLLRRRSPQADQQRLRARAPPDGHRPQGLVVRRQRRPRPGRRQPPHADRLRAPAQARSREVPVQPVPGPAAVAAGPLPRARTPSTGLPPARAWIPPSSRSRSAGSRSRRTRRSKRSRTERAGVVTFPTCHHACASHQNGGRAADTRTRARVSRFAR